MSHSNQSVCIIAVYFGRLPDYFEFWLYSCAQNPEFNWIFLTNKENIADRVWPNNVTAIPSSLADFSSRVQNTIDIQTTIKRAYKICDFRPTFGVVFKELLAGYDFWGFCDIDLIWGKLSHFITNNVLDDHDKILARGHLCIVRNVESVNCVYQKQVAPSYREILQSEKSFIFDEWHGFHRLCSESDLRCWNEEIVADIDPKFTSFHLTRHVNFPAQVFQYAKGEIHQVFKAFESASLEKREYAYVHFQKRNVKTRFNELETPLCISAADGIERLPTEELSYFDMLRKNNSLNLTAKPLSLQQRVLNKLKRTL